MIRTYLLRLQNNIKKFVLIMGYLRNLTHPLGSNAMFLICIRNGPSGSN